MNPLKNRLKFVFAERSEAVSSFKARLLRYARKDEVHGLCAALLSKTDPFESHPRHLVGLLSAL